MAHLVSLFFLLLSLFTSRYIFTTYHSYYVLCRTMLRFPGINIYSFKAHATDLPKKDLFGKSGIHPPHPPHPSSSHFPHYHEQIPTWCFGYHQMVSLCNWFLFFSFTSFSFVFLSPSLLFSLSSFCFPLFSLLSSCFFDTCKCKERKSWR